MECFHASYELAHSDQGIRHLDKCDLWTFGHFSVLDGHPQDVAAADGQEAQDIDIHGVPYWHTVRNQGPPSFTSEY